MQRIVDLVMFDLFRTELRKTLPAKCTAQFDLLGPALFNVGHLTGLEVKKQIKTIRCRFTANGRTLHFTIRADGLLKIRGVPEPLEFTNAVVYIMNCTVFL